MKPFEIKRCSSKIIIECLQVYYNELNSDNIELLKTFLKHTWNNVWLYSKDNFHIITFDDEDGNRVSILEGDVIIRYEDNTYIRLTEEDFNNTFTILN